MEHLANCPRCGSEKQEQAFSVVDHSISKEIFTLVDCGACGLRFTNGRPTQNTVGRYYIAENYISHSNTTTNLHDKLYQHARRYSLRNKYRFIHRLQPHGRVLDVGCGTGEFLAHLKGRGYLVQGVEPSLKAREQVIANFSIPVVPALDLVPTQEQFQVVTLWHVLEHLPDIRTTLKRIFALLAHGGILVIAVPDRKSWDAEHYGAHWAAWDVPRHFTHFRQEDVHAMLHEHGFELVQTRRLWLDALYISMLSETYRGSSKPWALLKGVVLGLWSNLQSIFGGRPTSSSLYIARKNEP